MSKTMPTAALLRDNATGEERWVRRDWSAHEAGEVPSAFWWTEGNAGCDCNRALFFYDGEVPADALDENGEVTCLPPGYDGNAGNPRFSLLRLTIGPWLLVANEEELDTPQRLEGV